MYKVINYAGLIAVTSCLSVSTVMAESSWPNRTVEVIVPYAPGGIADNVARILQPLMQDALGQTVIVHNRPGAAGSLATDLVARAKPDGYTFLLGLAAPQVLNQHLYKVNYDGVKDFAPVALINTNPMILVAHPSLPVHSVNELIAYAKKNPNTLNFSSAGGLTQYSGEIFKYITKTDMQNVAYRGGAPAVTAAVAGEVQITFANYSDALPWMALEKLRPLGLTSSERFPQSPEVPTIAESGGALSDYRVLGWSALFAPAHTPPSIVSKMNQIVDQALKRPDIIKRFEAIGAVPGDMSVDAFTTFVKAEAKKWGDFVKETGIKPE